MKRILNRIGEYCEHRQKYELALRIYDRSRSISVVPEDDFRIGNVHYRSGRFEDALQYLRRAVHAVPGNRLWETRYARAANNARKLEQEIKLNPSRTSARFQLIRHAATRCEGEGRTREAFDLYVEADSIHSTQDTIEAINRLAPADLPPWQKLEYHSRALEFHKNEFKWLSEHGDLCMKAKDYRAAGEHYLLAANGSPNAAWTPYKAGVAFESAGDPRAEVAYAMAVKRDRKFDAVRLGLGSLHEHANRHSRAAESFEHDAQNVLNTSTRAELLYRGGVHYQADLKLEDSERLLLAAHKLRPLSGKIAYNLAVTLDLASRYSEASKWYGRSRALGIAEPDMALEREILSLIRSGDHRAAASLFVADSKLENGHQQLQLAPKQALPPSSSVPPNCLDPDVDDLLYKGTTGVDAETCVQWSRILESTGDYAGSIRLLEHAIDVGPAIAPREIVHSLVKIHLLQNEPESAARSITHTIGQLTTVPTLAIKEKGRELVRRSKYREWFEEFPLREHVILYEANLGMSVDCNPLAIYRYIRNEVSKQYLHVWSLDDGATVPRDLVNSPNTIIVKKDTSEYTKYLATAKYLVNNSTFPTYFVRRNGQQYMMTWHGTPLKTLGKDQREVMTHANMARNYLQSSIAAFPNQHTMDVLLRGCDIEELVTANIQITGYPRIDMLVNQKRPSRQKKTILFAPTWRPDEGIANQAHTISRVVQCILESGHEPLVRAHHYVEDQVRYRNPSVPFADRSLPTNDLLTDVDVLITDFSSIYFDYAVTGNPILFMVPDWELYEEERGVYFSKQDLPGAVCSTEAELVENLRDLSSVPLPTKEFLEEFSSREDGQATRRCVQLLLGPVNTVAKSSRKRNLLFRQSFIPNGMASSFMNLIRHLPETRYCLSVVTDAQSLKEQPSRRTVSDQVAASANIIGRIGQIVRSPLEAHAHRTLQRDPEFVSQEVRQIDLDSFVFDSVRVTGHVQFDAVIEFDGYSEFMAKFVLGHRSRTKNCAIYLHNDINAEMNLRMPELREVAKLYNHFDRVVSVSETLARINGNKLSEFISDKSKLKSARNLIDLGKLVSESKAARDPDIESFMDAHTHIAVYVGRLSPEKNVRVLIDNFRRIQYENPGIGLLLLGDGPQRLTLEVYSQEQLETDSFMFAGHRVNPYPYIASSDLLVMTSLHEGQPMVILESLALGTSVVALDIPPLREFEQFAGVKLGVPDGSDFGKLVVQSCREETDVCFDGQAYVDDALSEFFTHVDFDC